MPILPVNVRAGQMLFSTAKRGKRLLIQRKKHMRRLAFFNANAARLAPQGRGVTPGGSPGGSPQSLPRRHPTTFQPPKVPRACPRSASGAGRRASAAGMRRKVRRASLPAAYATKFVKAFRSPPLRLVRPLTAANALPA